MSWSGGPSAATSAPRVANWAATVAVSAGSTRRASGSMVGEGLGGGGLGGVHVDEAQVGDGLLAGREGGVDHPAELVDGHRADGLGPEAHPRQQELGHRRLGGQSGHVGGRRAPGPQVPLDGVQSAEGLAGHDIGFELVEARGVDRLWWRYRASRKRS